MAVADSGLYSFKTYNRGNRLQSVEDSFDMGMQYTNVPLKTGFAHTLVNYQLSKDTQTLKPRPGMQVVEYAKIPTSDLGFVRLEPERLRFAALKRQVLPNTAVVPQVLLISPEYRRPVEPPYATHKYTPVTMVYGDTKLQGMERKATSLPYANAVRMFYPVIANAHGMHITNTETKASLVGTYAWNNSYYMLDNEKQLVSTRYNMDTQAFEFKADKPKQLTPKEAVTYGYNMLAEDPYSFVNTETASGSNIVFTGMLPYNKDHVLQLTPVMNQSLIFEAYYTAPKTSDLKIVWEWRSLTDSSWHVISDKNITVDVAKTKLQVTFSPPAESLLLRITAYPQAADNNLAVATLAVGFNFKKGEYGATANIDLKNYDLFNDAIGACYWRNRLVLWTAGEEANMLFTSDMNDPTYFPYPNNTSSFDAPIRYVVPFLDNLLVFTAQTLYMCTLNEDGMSWSSKAIQSNLSIAEQDRHLVQVVKNMVFFKSGNYYYMVVPKRTSTTGELVIAAISKPMEYFFDNFEESVADILSKTYNQPYDKLKLTDYYDFLDYDDIYINYVFRDPYMYQSPFDPNAKVHFINFSLIYNVVERTWRVAVSGSTAAVQQYSADATKQGEMCSFTKIMVDNVPHLVLELIKRNNQDSKDLYFPWGVSEADFVLGNNLPNWQYLDTGYRDHAISIKKRYRELQFMLNNNTTTALHFYTDFFIDGETRDASYKYIINHNTDKGSPDYGLITVERVLTDAKYVPGVTILAETEADTDFWSLDFSKFPTPVAHKVRFPVSGKGYTPRLIIASHNETMYDLLNVVWVYRTLNSR